jgi:tRNA pseudouridine55 synthase
VPYETLREALSGFVGEIEQVPPAFSAVKVAGQRAWKSARRQQQIELAPRRVAIYRVDLLGYTWPTLEVEVECGRGAYIRSLARDLGEKLGCGGYVEELRRLRVGPFRLENAVSLTVSPEEAQAALLPITAGVAELPQLVLPDAQRVHRLCQGQRLILPREYDRVTGTLPPVAEVAVLDEHGQLLGVARWEAQSRQLSPMKILAGG